MEAILERTSEKKQQRNHYADHLAAVNKNNEVKTTEDIRNDQGAVIVPKGTAVTPAIASKIARFKLSRPLEAQVNLERVITPQKLQSDIARVMSEDAGLGMPNLPGFKDKLAHHCHRYAEYPMLTQKLTVLSERLPRVYRNALLTSTTALSICDQSGLDEKTTHAVFIATQMHDAGLLNISPDIVNKKGKLTREEWRALQGHVVIGKLFLDMVPNLPKAAGKAVFEHHERLDGTGYPKGKTADDLGLEGQIIALADTVNAIYHNRLKPLGYQVRDLVPVLQMSSHVFPSEIHNSYLQIVAKSNNQVTRVISNERIQPLANFLLVLQKLLLHWCKLAIKFNEDLVEADIGPKAQQVKLMVGRLNQTLNQSGLFTTELRDWLKGLLRNPDPREYQEVEHTALMFDEFCYQLQQLHRLMDAAVHGRGDALEEQCNGMALLLKDIPKNRLKISGE
ncbi:MAG: HD domain-containing phosphohydrolase [Oleiphilaceae bacterium]|nr:HD domain-containing phosphohydrolase [Oleiphilaceae bacterium]